MESPTKPTSSRSIIDEQQTVQASQRTKKRSTCGQNVCDAGDSTSLSSEAGVVRRTTLGDVRSDADGSQSGGGACPLDDEDTIEECKTCETLIECVFMGCPPTDEADHPFWQVFRPENTAYCDADGDVFCSFCGENIRCQ